MSLDVTGVAANQPLLAAWKSGRRTAGDRPSFGRENITDSGISLTSLIEIFSHPAKPPSRTGLETGPVTLDELRRNRPRG